MTHRVAEPDHPHRRSHRHPARRGRQDEADHRHRHRGDPRTLRRSCACSRRSTRAPRPACTELVLNPDAHCGYGAPVGCVLVSPTHIYPGPVGVDIKCSMSLLQLDLPADAIVDRPTRRALINAICERIPTGAGRGQRSVRSRAGSTPELGRAGRHRRRVGGGLRGARHPAGVGRALRRLAPRRPRRHDATPSASGSSGMLPRAAFRELRRQDAPARLLRRRQPLRRVRSRARRPTTSAPRTAAEVVRPARTASVAFLSHCGSRGFGHNLAIGQFQRAAEQVRDVGHPAARRATGARLRAARHARGRRLPRRHGAGGELRHGQPPADQRPRAGGVSGGRSRA